MNKKLTRQQEEELRRKQARRFAELSTTAHTSWTAAPPRIPRKPTQSRMVSREEEVRRAWALAPSSLYGVHRGLGNSAVRSILDPDRAALRDEGVTPGQQMLAALLANDELALDAASEPVPSGPSGGDATGDAQGAVDPTSVTVHDPAAGLDVTYDLAGGAPEVDLKQVDQQLGGGRPLDGETREYMEWRFGLNLGSVRIHTGPKADALSKALMAHAFALGNQVAFAGGQYRPGTAHGDFLLAHELTHVVQAGHATPLADDARKSSSVSEPTDAIEVQADQVAAEVTSVGRSEFARARREGLLQPGLDEEKAKAARRYQAAPTARKAAGLTPAPPARSTGQRAVQKKERESKTDIQQRARQGASTPSGRLPFAERIQKAFGRHDVTGVQAHTGSAAQEAATDIGARAYATGNDVVFGETPDLHTAAHEAAHVVQQRAGVHLPGGVGQAGDTYERHADAVADAVVHGRSAEPLLDSFANPTFDADEIRSHADPGLVERTDARYGQLQDIAGRWESLADLPLAEQIERVTAMRAETSALAFNAMADFNQQSSEAAGQKLQLVPSGVVQMTPPSTGFGGGKTIKIGPKEFQLDKNMGPIQLDSAAISADVTVSVLSEGSSGNVKVGSTTSSKGVAGVGVAVEQKFDAWANTGIGKIEPKLEESAGINSKEGKIGLKAGVGWGDLATTSLDFTFIGKEWGEKGIKFMTLTLGLELEPFKTEWKAPDGTKVGLQFKPIGELNFTPNWKQLAKTVGRQFLAVMASEAFIAGAFITGGVLCLAVYLDAVMGQGEIAGRVGKASADLDAATKAHETYMRTQDGSPTSDITNLAITTAAQEWTDLNKDTPEPVLNDTAQTKPVASSSRKTMAPKVYDAAMRAYRKAHDYKIWWHENVAASDRDYSNLAMNLEASLGCTGETFNPQMASKGTAPVQQKEDGSARADVHAAADHALSGAGGALPFVDQIQEAFGHHDVSSVSAHTDSKATEGAQAMGARAFAQGSSVAFAGTPDLHTAAHEAAHVVQQQHGVSLDGGVGAAGDRYEQHADQVADAVVRGDSAEPMLDSFAGVGAGTSVQAKADVQLARGPVQLDGDEDEERDPEPHHLTEMDSGAVAVSDGESAASGELGSPGSPASASMEEAPAPAAGEGAAFGDLACVDPTLDMSGPTMPSGPTSVPSERAVDQALDAVGPGHSGPADASESLLGSAWGMATGLFHPLVGYNKDRGGFKASNFLKIGPSIDGVVSAYKSDRGEGFWATVAETADLVRSVAKGVQSVCGAIGLVTRILSLVGLFPPLAPVGAFLATVSSVCSTISFISGIVAAATQFIATIAQAIMLVQGVKDGAPNVLEMYAQYQQDVGNFVSDGIAVAVDLVFKKVGKKFGQAKGAKKGMANYRDVLATADGRVARGTAFRALKDLGTPNLAGNLLSTAGSTRAELTRMLVANNLKATGHNVLLSAIKSPIKTEIKGGFSSAGKRSAAEVRADATTAASSSASSATESPIADTVRRLIEQVPDQPTPPPVPAPTHSTTELDEIQARREEIEAARAHVEAIRAEGQAAIEAGEQLQCEADSHDQSAAELDSQVTRHGQAARDMQSDAEQGIDQVDDGADKNAEMGEQGGKAKSEAEGAQQGGSAVNVPKPERSKSVWGSIKAWFKEKVFAKVAEAFKKVNEFIASIVLKAIAGLMGVDDIEGKLAEARGGLETAQGAAQETEGRTEQVSQQASQAHEQAAEASSVAQTAVSGGQSTVGEADSLLAQLDAEEQRLSSEATTVQQETTAYRDQYGETIDEAAIGGPPTDPAILSGLEQGIEDSLSGIDRLEGRASSLGQQARDALLTDARAGGIDPSVLEGGVGAPIEEQFVQLTGRMDQRRSDLAGLSAALTGVAGQPYALIESQLGEIAGRIHGIAASADADYESFRQTVEAALGGAASLVSEQAAEVAAEDDRDQAIQDSSMSAAESGIQRKAPAAAPSGDVVQQAAAHGTAGAGGALPFASQIQKSFGKHDVSGIKAHTGPAASDAASAMGARAFATGSDVAFKGSPDLHTAAHEAAHVVQQKQGVSLAGGIGKAGDRYEKHADAVADAVVAGRAAQPLLDSGPTGSPGVQRQAVQRDDDDREPETGEQGSFDAGAPAVSEASSEASSALGSDGSPTPATMTEAPAEAAPGGDGFGDLMCVDPDIDMSAPTLPQGPTSLPSDRAVDQVLNANGPGHSAPAEASGSLLGSAWGVATSAFHPLVGYNKNRGGWKASNFLNIGPAIDGVIGAYKRDRGEGFWATVAETADVVRSVAKGVQSICGAVGLVTRVLSLVGLFPPLAPVGAFLASVSSVCSTVSFIAGIVAAATQFIAMIAQAVMVVQGVKDGAPNVLEMYAQYQEDVGNFISDGIAVAVDLVFKKIGKKAGQSSGAKKGMGNYRDVLATADGRVARGAAFRALKDVGTPNLAGNLLSTAGSTREALTSMLRTNVARATVHNIALTTLKSPIKGEIKGGFSSAGKRSAAEVRADATAAASGRAASAPAPRTEDTVRRLIETVPNQTAPPVIPGPTHSPTELDELQQRREEVAAARAYVEAVRAEGQGAIEAGEELMCEAESHEESATEMDRQTERHGAGAKDMESDADQGIRDVERGEQKNAEMGQQGGQIQNEAEGAQGEGSGVDVPAPKKATSWWGRLKAWFKEKVFAKVKAAFKKVNEFIASIVLKAVAGLMGVDDMEGKLAEARAGLVNAQGAAQETGQRTEQVSQQAGEGHAQAAEASSAAQTAISEGQSTVGEADGLIAQLDAEEQRLSSESTAVQSETNAYRAQWGESIDEAAVGGPPTDPAILSGLEGAVENTLSSMDTLESDASLLGQAARDGLVADARAGGIDPSLLLSGVAAPLEDQFADLCTHYDGHRAELAGLSAELTGLASQPYALVEEQLGRISGDLHGVASCVDSDFEGFRRTIQTTLAAAAELLVCEAQEVAQEDAADQGLQDAAMSQAEAGIQRKSSSAGPSAGVVQKAAAAGTSDAGGPLPYRAQIQKSFGKHDVGGVKAHTGAAATQASQAMGARAFATGTDVAFSGTPDLHTAAHEAAHVVQQKQGVSLKGGVGKTGDVYEKQADAAADAVVAGRSAEPLLSRPAGGSPGVQRQAVQRDGDEREPESKEDGSYAQGEPAVSQAEGAAPPAGGEPAPAPATEQVEPAPPMPGSGGPDELMCVDPSLPDAGVSMPAGPTTAEPARVAETLQESRGPTHSPPANASGGLLGAAWNVTTDAFGPLVGYKRSRGGWKASNFLNLGPSWDNVVKAANNDRGGGWLGNLARTTSTIRNIAEGIRSVCSAVGLVTRVLSLVGLFPPLAPVGAFLATVSTVCSKISWIAAIVATSMSALTTVFSAISLVQGIKDGSPKAAELYQQFSKDVSTFTSDGIGLLVDKAFKTKKLKGDLGGKATGGMKSYKDVLKTADGRSARGAAFQGLKNIGGPNFAGNLLSTKGSTRAVLTSMLRSDVARVTVSKIGVDLVKRELKTGLKTGGKALSTNLMALGNTSVVEAASKRAATPATGGIGDAVRKALESTPDQAPPPVIPEPVHSPVEMDELQARRGELAKARLHVDGVRGEGVAAIEGGEALQSEADKHDSSATALDGQVKKQKSDLTGMDKQAETGLKEIGKGQGESGKAGESGKKAEADGQKAKGEGSGVSVPKPKKATSWWGRLKAWFKEKVFAKVKAAMAKVEGFIADIILKAVAGIMGIDDIDSKLAEIKGQMTVAQQKNAETRAGTAKVTADSKKAHGDAASAGADAQKAIAKGRKTVAEAEAMDARLVAEDAKLAAEAGQVQSDTTAFKDTHGADIDEAARGGAPVDPAVLAGYAGGVDRALTGLDALEDRASEIGQSARDALADQARAAKFDPAVLSAVSGEIDGRFTELTGRMDGRRGRLASLSAEVMALEGQPYAVIEDRLGLLGADIHSIAGEADEDVAAFGRAVGVALSEAAAMWRAQAAEVIAKKQKVGVLQRKAAAPVQKMTHAPVQKSGGDDEAPKLKTEQRKSLLVLRRIVGKDPKKIQKRRVWKLILQVVGNWGDHLVADLKPEPRLTRMAAETILQVTQDPLRMWFQRAATTGKIRERELKKASRYLKTPKFIGAAESGAVQKAGGGAGSAGVHEAAAAGTSGAGSPMPFQSQIQKSFGKHDVSGIKAHTGSDAKAASASMGARAYATGSSVAFGGTPDLHTAAHEAAHVVQQRRGVSLAGGVGKAGDKYEQHADAVASAVVSGRSAEGMLDGGAAGTPRVQKSEDVQLIGLGQTVQMTGSAFDGRASVDLEISVQRKTVQADGGGGSAEPRVVKGGGGYTYQQFPDGTVVIVDGPSGVGKSYGPGSTVNKAITGEIGPHPNPATGQEQSEDAAAVEEDAGDDRSIGDIPLSLANGEIDWIQTRVDELTGQAESGGDFSDADKDFIGDLYWWIGAGGHAKGLKEAGKLQRHYVKGSGDTLEINSVIYETSAIVQYAMGEMKKIIETRMASEEDVSSLSSTEVLSATNQGDQATLGEIIKGGYLLAEQDNQRLKYANNRFALQAFTEQKEGFWFWQEDSWTETRWRVDDRWDFASFPEQKEKGRNDVTHIPLPGGSVLKLPDGLSHYLTEQDIAAEFDYWSEWTEKWQPSGAAPE
jgi:hypothetical protein